MRGERDDGAGPAGHVHGSSPHARGTHWQDVSCQRECRFIPACAGNAHYKRLRLIRQPVHPRMRGERLPGNRYHRAAGGSSPHARGTLKRPTCASSIRTVHPRMRGERNAEVPQAVTQAGSSPHARGTPDLRNALGRNNRFIPACAGNAKVADFFRLRMSVHPRMRGERLPNRGQVPPGAGSSPHARGTRRPCSQSAASERFIPACAGNADTCWRSAFSSAVHPRMRGERVLVAGFALLPVGSSPHARGTHVCLGRCGDGLRFIPACAGNATFASPPRPIQSVHPRMRGERTSNKLLIYRRKSEPSDSTKHSGC